MPARVSHACELCRGQRRRCLPGTSTSTCKACERAGLRCVTHTPTKRGTESKQTIEDLSRQVFLLQNIIREQSQGLLPSAPNPRVNTILSTVLRHPTLGDVISAKLVSAGIQDMQCPRLWKLDMPTIGTVLQNYNLMATKTPFCTMAALSDIPIQLEGNTVFTLAAMLVAPDTDHEITKQLDFVFHRVLTDQAMVRGKQNIDLLNGLVTYLMWFHHRYDPETQQYYQYLQLAKAMAEDLRLVKWLEGCTSEAERTAHIEVARIVAGLCFIDRGTVILDTVRIRSTISNYAADVATRLIHDSSTRSADECACDIMHVIYQSSSSSSNLATAQGCGSTLASDESCNYYGIVHRFWLAWSCLHGQRSVTHDGDEIRALCSLHFANLKTVIRFVQSKSIAYLHTMTIVEWAYFLASLITIPHLEIMGGDILKGCTAEIAQSINAWLMQEQQNDPQLFQNSKHLWWLLGIARDISSTVSTGNGIASLEDLIAASPYELLEQLTERLCGFRKGVNCTQSLTPRSNPVDNSNEDDTWARVIAEWTNLN